MVRKCRLYHRSYMVDINIALKARRFLGFLSLRLMEIGYFLQISSHNVILVGRVIYTPGS